MAGLEILLERGFEGLDLQAAPGIHRDDPQVVAAQAQEFDGFADAAMALRAGVDEQATSKALQPSGSHVCPQLGFKLHVARHCQARQRGHRATADQQAHTGSGEA